MTKRLETVQAVIETLYGRAADAARALKRSRTAIWKYQQREELPGEPSTSAMQARATLLNGYEIADELFTPVTIHPSVLFRKEA
jgi:hypothetical protein